MEKNMINSTGGGNMTHYKGTIITCKEIKTTGNGDVWLRCPSGWVAAIYGGTVYIK